MAKERHKTTKIIHKNHCKENKDMKNQLQRDTENYQQTEKAVKLTQMTTKRRKQPQRFS